MDQEMIEDLRQKIARLEKQIVRSEAQMAVHPEKFDDQKKGQTCRNWIARATFKKERDRYAQELVELKARLDAELGGRTPVTPDQTPEPVLDYVI